ncbi:MAG: sulfotransferase [Terricaulis sp.]
MATALAEPVGTISAALAQASLLLRSNPALAEEQALEILKVAPAHSKAALTLGLARARMGRHQEAAEALRRATQADPGSTEAWRALGDQLTLIEDRPGADAAYAQSIRASVNDPKLMEAALALCEGKLAGAERVLRAHLYERPTDVAAIRMLAEVGARLGRYEDSEKLLQRALELAPSFTAARHNYAIVLHRQSKAVEALAQIDLLLEHDADNPAYRFLKAAALTRIGEYDSASSLYRQLLEQNPNNARGWLSLGHATKTAGRQNEGVAAYLKSIALAPNFGEAYWSLANLKTYRFSDADQAAMLDQLKRAELSPEDRFHFHFALGKMYEDRGEYAQSFEHYAEGARQRRQGIAYEAGETTAFTDALIEQFSPAFMAERKDLGATALDPIFIVGLPRSGSTLIEQILASHSAIEGTMELPDIITLAKEIGGGRLRGGSYPKALAEITGDHLRKLGEAYLSRTKVQRKTSKPYFIDKMPNNFQHAGFIRLILPNAKVIDARRHPMACCFSAFKQHFAYGQRFSYDLDDLGRYYRDYVRLMAHFGEAMPGAVHRVYYEDMVSAPEAETRRLLAFLGLPFEPACLEFHSNDRAVRTASSEQVRQPLYSSAREHWRNYEAWLGPLRTALGPALDNYQPRLPYEIRGEGHA